MIILLLKKFSNFFAEDGSLLQDQGPYGTDSHFDGKDDPSAFSLAIVCSQLHESYELGQFSLNAAAIHWILHSGLGAIFSGLESHGGTTLKSPSLEILPWCLRMLVIGYTPLKMVHWKSSYGLAAGPKHALVTLAPEMMLPESISE